MRVEPRGAREMATFYGTLNYSIDDKGRIVVPASMRVVRGRKAPLTTFILLKGLDNCLWLYAEEDWTNFEQRLGRLSMGTKQERAVARAFLMDACKVTVDKQGRISVPPSLIGRAGLGKDAILHGQVGRIEIWAPDRFKESTDPALENMDEEYDRVVGDKL
jgi:MraZ protein